MSFRPASILRPTAAAPVPVLAPVLALGLLVLGNACGDKAKPPEESGASGASGASAPADAAIPADAAAIPADAAPADAASPDAAAAVGMAPATAAALGLPPAIPIPEPNPGRAKTLLAGDFKTLPSGTRVLDVAPGSGTKLEKGMTATFSYVTYLENGAEIDRSDKVGAPITLPGIGNDDIMPFLNDGLLGLGSGGKRRLIVPPDQAYGPQGRPPIIPPNATLIFEVQLVGAQAALPTMTMPDVKAMKFTTTPSGLKWADVVTGPGNGVKAGDDVLVNYAGFLEDGTEFDSSAKTGRPMPVGSVGSSGVIAGWNEGLIGMKSGGRRVLVIPPALAFGERGFPGAVPPNSTVIFVLDALQVRGR